MSCLSPIPYFMLFLLSYKKSGADFLCRSPTSSCSSTSWVPPNALEAPATSRSLYLSFLIYFEMEDKCFIMLLVSAIQQHQSAMLFAVQLPCRVKLFATPWTTACQTSLLLPISRGLPKFMSIASVMPSNHLILCVTLFSFCLQSFPASGSFPMSWLFSSGGQSTGASASVLPMSIQCWFPLRLTDKISLQSKELARVSSSTTVQKHQFFSAQPSL